MKDNTKTHRGCLAVREHVCSLEQFPWLKGISHAASSLPSSPLYFPSFPRLRLLPVTPFFHSSPSFHFYVRLSWMNFASFVKWILNLALNELAVVKESIKLKRRERGGWVTLWMYVCVDGWLYIMLRLKLHLQAGGGDLMWYTLIC